MPPSTVDTALPTVRQDAGEGRRLIWTCSRCRRTPPPATETRHLNNKFTADGAIPGSITSRSDAQHGQQRIQGGLCGGHRCKEPFQEPTWTDLRRRLRMLGHYSGSSSARSAPSGVAGRCPGYDCGQRRATKTSIGTVRRTSACSRDGLVLLNHPRGDAPRALTGIPCSSAQARMAAPRSRPTAVRTPGGAGQPGRRVR